MSDRRPIRIDVVSDIVCPWCFIGKRRLEKALALASDVPVEVHYRPYYLNEWIPAEGMSRDEYLTTKFGSPERYKGIAQRVQAAAAAEGLVYAVDSISRQPNTRDAHRLIRWAEDIGKAPDMKQRLMDLYFTEGADLSNEAVLVQAAISLGHNLGLSVLAEGVESAAQREWLAALSCDEIQGFVYGRPVPTSAAESFLRHRC